MILSQAADGKVEREKKCEGVGVVERLTKMMCWVGGGKLSLLCMQ